MCWWPPLQLSSQNPPLLTLDVYAPHSLRLTSSSWGHFTFSHTRLPACLLSCLPHFSRPPAFASCLCLSHLSFISIIIVLSLLDFIVTTAFDHCLAVPETRSYQESRATQSAAARGSLSARHPSASACGLPFRCWANRAPFYLLYPPRLVRHQVPVTGRASKHVTYPSSLFFLSSSPLELSASLDLLAHRQDSRDLFPCRHLCACG